MVQSAVVPVAAARPACQLRPPTPATGDHKTQQKVKTPPCRPAQTPRYITAQAGLLCREAGW